MPTGPIEIAQVNDAIDALEDALDAGTNHPEKFRDSVVNATNILHRILGLTGIVGGDPEAGTQSSGGGHVGH